MDHPFFADHLSEIHEADTLYDSRFSISREHEQENWFQEQRTYAKSTLNSWGITVGELTYNRQNQVTLRCLVELIGYRQKQLQFRSRSKDEMSKLQFQCDKYRSFMQQGQRTIQEHMKRIGCLQNQLMQLRGKIKKNEGLIKKEKEEDRKMIAMLKNKNEQILHEIKKKEQQTNRIKEQMKKNVVGQKTPSKNTFDVIHTLNRSISKERQLAQEKYAFLLQRNERELSIAMKQNGILRQKIFEMRECLVEFNVWIDKQIFGEEVEDSPRKYHHKFYINHNLLFKKESLTQELAQLLETTKDGLIELREILRQNRSPPRVRVQPKQVEQQTELNFKKKAPQRKQMKTDRTSNDLKQRENKRISITKNIENNLSQQPTPKISKQAYQAQTQVNIKHMSSHSSTKIKHVVQPKKVGLVVTKLIPSNQLNFKSAKDITKTSKQQLPAQQQLLSEFSDSQDESIISHISIQKMGKNKFDKWDLLYHDEKQS